MKKKIMMGLCGLFAGYHFTTYALSETPASTYELRYIATRLEEYHGDDPDKEFTHAMQGLVRVIQADTKYKSMGQTESFMVDTSKDLDKLRASYFKPGQKTKIPRSAYQHLFQKAADEINETANEHDKDPLKIFLGSVGAGMIMWFAYKPELFTKRKIT